ncbi:hypothetical protein LguiA_027212 [Lonicera macranthoides]
MTKSVHRLKQLKSKVREWLTSMVQSEEPVAKLQEKQSEKQDKPIAKRLTIGSSHQLDLKVSDIISAFGGWDMENLNLLLPLDIIKEIVNTSIPIKAGVDDKPTWGGKGSGKFTVSKCYNTPVEDLVDHN